MANRQGFVLVTNRSEDEGIGVYARELYNSLSKLASASLIDLTTSPPRTALKTLDGLIYGALQTLSLLRVPNNAEIYHFTSPGYFEIARHFHSAPTITTIHDLSIFDCKIPGMSWVLKQSTIDSIRNSSGLICASYYTKERLLNVFNNVPPLSVVHYGVNATQFRPRDRNASRKLAGLPESKHVVLYVGDTGWRKNMETLFVSYRKLEKHYGNSILFLHVGGDEESVRRLEKIFEVTSVLHLPHVPHREIHTYYNAADVFLFPSRYEGFGMPPLEAMASGIPVISSNATSLTEVVGDGGILLDASDIDGFTDSVIKVLSEPRIAQELTARGITQSSKFSWERASEDSLKFYKQILG